MKAPVRTIAYINPATGVSAPATFIGATVSRVINLESIKRVGIQFIRTNHTAGTSTFIVEVTNDESAPWVQFNKLVDNVANTNAQNNTRVASVALAANGAKIYGMDLQYEMYKFMRITCTNATDGAGQAIVLKEREM